MCRRHLNDQLAVQTTSLALPRCAPITGLARSGLARPWRAMLDFHSQFMPKVLVVTIAGTPGRVVSCTNGGATGLHTGSGCSFDYHAWSAPRSVSDVGASP